MDFASDLICTSNKLDGNVNEEYIKFFKESMYREAQTAMIGHLGLVAQGMADLGIIDMVNKLIDPCHPQQRVSMGHRVVAMVMNLLSFHNRTLYATPELLSGYAFDVLLGNNATPDAFNDDALGSCLDKIADFGNEKFFNTISLNMIGKIDLGGRSLKLDSTSMCLQGSYESSKDGKPDDGGVRVTFGHSKDGRADLKQVMLTLATTGPANLPILACPQDGNSSDKTEFIKIIKNFQENFQLPERPFWIADSALYSKKWLKSQSNKNSQCSVAWLTRVPESIKLAQEVIILEEDHLSWYELNNGYKSCYFTTDWGGVNQIWVLYYSKQAYERENQTFEKHFNAEKELLKKKLWHLSNRIFSCAEDAKNSLTEIFKSTKFHRLKDDFEIKEFKNFGKAGRPKREEEPNFITYSIHAEFIEDHLAIELYKRKMGKFILATNVVKMSKSRSDIKNIQLDKGHVKILVSDLTESNFSENSEEVIGEEKMLLLYKSLQGTEQGFKFLKNYEFMINHFYLKKEKRIGALMILFALALFVYGYLNYVLMKKLDESNYKLPNPEGRPLKTNTLKRMFDIFRTVTAIRLGSEDGYVITKLKKNQIEILNILGPPYKRRYGID